MMYAVSMTRLGLVATMFLSLTLAGPAAANGDAPMRPGRSAGAGEASAAEIAIIAATPADRPLALAVAKALETFLRIGPYGVTVAADQGRVILYGAVPTLFTLSLADQVAAGVPGVSAVNNQLVVSSLDPSLVDPERADTAWPACAPNRLCVGS